MGHEFEDNCEEQAEAWIYETSVNPAKRLALPTAPSQRKRT